jgi:CRP-like cAMP-binding protein
MRRREIEPRQFLGNLPLFEELGAPAVARIAAQATKVRLARGTTLFRRGEMPSGFYVVVFGEIRLLARGARGKRLSGIVGPGRSFGEPVMFLGKPYHVDAVAHDDALLIHVPKDAVLGEIEASPTFARRVIAGLAARIDALVRELDTQVRGTARERLAAYLLRGSGAAGGETIVTLPATKAAIASQLGLTPEHLSRTLHDLAAHGLLRVEGRRIVIGDAERLAQHAGTSRRKRRQPHA